MIWHILLQTWIQNRIFCNGHSYARNLDHYTDFGGLSALGTCLIRYCHVF
jgi:hypothetical protein